MSTVSSPRRSGHTPATPAPAIEWARHYAERGYHPIRLAPGQKFPKGADAVGWQTKPLDFEALCTSLEQAPRSNLGLRMGVQPDGRARIAVDVDDFDAASELGVAVPDTLTARTPRGGIHLVYEVDPNVLALLANFTKRSGIDLRAQGGQIAVAPSVIDGKHYQWVDPDAEIARLDHDGEGAALLRFLLDASAGKVESPTASSTCPPELVRDDRWLEHAREALRKVPPAEAGDGGVNLILAASVAMRGWLLPRGAAEALLLEPDGWNDRCDPPWNLRDSEHKANWDHTMARADSKAASTIAWGSSRPIKPGSRIGKLEHYTHPDEIAEACADVVARAVSGGAAGRDPAVDNVIASLAAPSVNVFQRAGALVTVTREACDAGGVVRPVGAPTIRTLALARLREIIRMTTGPRDVPLASEVMARGEWSDIRPLDAITTYPVMRRDGSLLLESGYDAETRTLANIDVRVDVPEAPTHAHAQKALAVLLDLVSDFPFASAAHCSAWLAMLLTVPARPAIDGPTPLGLLEASQRGSGKTLLADVLSVIVTGATVPRRVAPKTKEEWDKTMLATLAAGDPLVLIDNVTNMLVSDALDAVLTGTTYTGRWLGVSENRTVAIRTVFLASANNARLSTDLVRRSLGCRLEPDVEQPEARTGFRHPDLLAHAKANRAPLLGAALTIIRAYAVAERPIVDARPMGSYSAWSHVVRDALVWAGAPDPAETQDALRETADVERDELRDLLTAWHEALGARVVTVRELISEARSNLLDALRGMMPGESEPSARVIGNRLRTKRGTIADGLVLCEGRRARSGYATWQVVRR